MSQENVEIVRRVSDAYNRRDVEAMLDELHPEIEWHPWLQIQIGGEALRLPLVISLAHAAADSRRPSTLEKPGGGDSRLGGASWWLMAGFLNGTASTAAP